MTNTIDRMTRAHLAEVLADLSRTFAGIATRSLAAAPVEVTVTQHRLLVLLQTAGPMGVGALSADLGVNPSNGTRLCDRLAQLGLIERYKDMTDRRAVAVDLTSAGRDVLGAVRAAQRREVLTVIDRVDDRHIPSMINEFAHFADIASRVL